MEPVRKAAQALLARQPGITNATAILTAHKGPSPASTPGARQGNAAPRPAGHSHAHGPGPGGGGAKAPLLLPDVKAIVAVASGKGGVGKSTVAVNLAVSLARQGHRTGLLDADIYGPSLPRMLGVHRKPEVRDDKMIPLQAWGLACMSIGFLVDEETPMIWRGPMVMGALEQMMGQVSWGPLDVLVVDMPPGTGDAQLTMAQRVSLTGAVIVSTPQDIALLDARRGVKMFEKTLVPVLGLVENMSFFCCPNCGHRTDIFGHGGARVEAERLGIDSWAKSRCCWTFAPPRTPARRSRRRLRTARRRKPMTTWRGGSGTRCRSRRRWGRKSSSSEGGAAALAAGPRQPAQRRWRQAIAVRQQRSPSPPAMAVTRGDRRGFHGQY